LYAGIERSAAFAGNGMASAISATLISISPRASQCLDRRIADKQILANEVNAWQDHRNKHHAKANWQFKTADAPRANVR
jgi:hypothetical protein